MKSLLKLLPLKYKRKLNKLLRSVGLAAPAKRRDRKTRTVTVGATEVVMSVPVLSKPE